MKSNKILCLLFVFILSFTLFILPAAAEDNIKVILNGEQITFDVPPQIVNDRTMVPMRTIFEKLGASVQWLEETQTIYAHFSSHTIHLKIDDPEMHIMDSSQDSSEQSQQIISLDVSPVVIDGRTLVPVRAIAEALGLEVNWDGNMQTVIISQGTNVNINDPEIQELFNNTQSGDSFISYYPGYADVNLFDTTNYSWLGGHLRELITILSLKDVPNKKYTDTEAHDMITQFISKGEINEDSKLNLLKTAIEDGDTFGETAKEERFVGIYQKDELDEISIKLFGTPLPKSENLAYSIAYASFFLYNRTNFLEQFPMTLSYNLYYNEASEEYLFTSDLSMLSQWSMEDYLTYYNEYYKPLKSNTKLLRATRYGDEISLYVYREAEFGEYSGGTGSYQGEYKNTYKKSENGYYWVSSFGSDSIED